MTMQQSFLGKRDFHWTRRRYFESLKSILSSARLNFTLKLNKRNVVSSRNEPHFFEAREPTPHTVPVTQLTLNTIDFSLG